MTTIQSMKITASPSAFLGIDVGKAELFCYLLNSSKAVSAKFDNTPAGIKMLISWLFKDNPPHSLAACLEQTGIYGLNLAQALFKCGISALHLVNPYQIKAFGQQKLRRNKSDKADAKLIAEFLRSEHLTLQAWEPRSACQDSVTELGRYAASLTKDNAQLKTRLESVRCMSVRQSIQRRIKSGEKELTKIRDKISAEIARDTKLSFQFALLETAPGIGKITAQTLLAELPELDLFGSGRQLAAWAGLTPQHHASGTSGRPTTPITKVGSAHLRSALFLPAMTARVHNPLLKEFADRLEKNGKKGKQIIIAVMRKLLHQIFGMLKSGEPFDPTKRGYKTNQQTHSNPPIS